MKGRQIHYSEDELVFIKINSKLPRKDLHRQFCDKFKKEDISMANLSSLCKRKDWLTGRTGCFKKGNIPHPDAHPKGPIKTSFKKGNRPKNWRPVGSERITKDGYKEVKIEEPRKWKSKHIIVWEKKHGAIPDGHLVIFLNSDKLDCSPKNLMMIDRRVNMYLNQNGYGDLLDADLKKVAIMTAKLHFKVKSKEV